MITGYELIEKMYSENYDEYEDTRLYSTGDSDLDDLLERAFCEGYEYAQKEFSENSSPLLNKNTFIGRTARNVLAKYKRNQHVAAQSSMKNQNSFDLETKVAKYTKNKGQAPTSSTLDFMKRDVQRKNQNDYLKRINGIQQLGHGLK